MKPQEFKAKRVKTDPSVVRILLGGRATYAFLMEAQEDDPDNPDSKKSYKSGILLPKKAPAEVLSIVKTAIMDSVKVGIKKKWGGKKPMSLQLPLSDGDEKYAEDKDKYDAYKGMFYMNAKKRENLGKPILRAYGKTVTEAGIIESGDYCVFDINFYPYANRAKGVAVALNAVTLIKQGERFGGGPTEDSIEEEASSLYGDSLGSQDLFDGDDDDMLADFMGGSNDDDDLLAGL